MAKQMIRLAGKNLNEIEIKFTGLRPGEKMNEELFHHNEHLLKTHHDKIMRVEPRKIIAHDLTNKFKIIKAQIQICDEQALLKLLKLLVPEFSASNDDKLFKDKVELKTSPFVTH